jgi:hypothetical protein
LRYSRDHLRQRSVGGSPEIMINCSFSSIWFVPFLVLVCYLFDRSFFLLCCVSFVTVCCCYCYSISANEDPSQYSIQYYCTVCSIAYCLVYCILYVASSSSLLPRRHSTSTTDAALTPHFRSPCLPVVTAL